MEAEIVICVGRDAPPDKVEWTLDEAAELVGELCIGIEIASSPLATLNDLGAGAIISDFGNNWGVVVGSSVSDWRSLHEVTNSSGAALRRCGRARSPPSRSRSRNARDAAVRCERAR